jgi:capsular polysaccharide biosynthesis protein
MRDLFAMAGVAGECIVPHDSRTTYKLEASTIPSLRNPHALLDDRTLAFYAAMRDRFGTRRGARKIFVSRLGWSGSDASTRRRMVNEEAVKPSSAPRPCAYSGSLAAQTIPLFEGRALWYAVQRWSAK